MNNTQFGEVFCHQIKTVIIICFLIALSYSAFCYFDEALTWRGKGFYDLQVTVPHQEKPKGNLQSRTEAVTTEEHCLLACPRLVQLPQTIQDLLPRGGTTQSALIPL